MECFNLGDSGEWLLHYSVFTCLRFLYMLNIVLLLGDEIHYMLEKSQVLGNQVVSIIVQFLRVLSI